jgi:folate-binding protein YgfZ
VSASELAARCRRGAGLFVLSSRGLVTVEGRDRTRWLDGMLTNDVKRLAPGRERSGCHALLLTRIGRIVSDVHVLLHGEAFWLELEAAALPKLVETLRKFIIADDVRLTDRSAEHVRLSLEGPASEAVFAAAAGEAPGLAVDSGDTFSIAGTPVIAAAWGVSGEPALQLFVPPESVDAVAAALREAGRSHGLVDADEAALEVLRIEAGTPRFGHELGESVLPAETGLVHAISDTKGCYTGQEIVARMASRGEASHALVGLAFEGPEPPPAPGSAVEAQGARAGELTSATVSASAGAIALAYVRRAFASPGTPLGVGSRAARVHALPFVRSGA